MACVFAKLPTNPKDEQLVSNVAVSPRLLLKMLLLVLLNLLFVLVYRNEDEVGDSDGVKVASGFPS